MSSSEATVARFHAECVERMDRALSSAEDMLRGMGATDDEVEAELYIMRGQLAEQHEKNMAELARSLIEPDAPSVKLQ